MKNLFTFIALFWAVGIHAQNTNITPDMLNEAYCAKLDSMALVMYSEKQYENALQLKLRQTEILKRMKGEGDADYIKCLGFLPKIYYRNNQIDKAIETTRKTVELWGQHVSDHDNLYAIFLDNLSLYQADAGKNKEALQNGLKSLSVYEKLLVNDDDMATILMHCAEYSWANGKMNDAVKYELRALDIIKDLQGELSDKYIDELEYLKRYYQDAGDTDNANKLDGRITELKKKAENKFNLEDLATAEGCRYHNHEALACAQYLLDNPLDDPQIQQITSYILTWSVGSPDVNIVIESPITDVLNAEGESQHYLTAYIAACIDYCLTHKVKELDENGKKKVLWQLVNYYAANRHITGQVPALEQYLSE
ncbi:MAG: hypothetical protein IKX36_08090 [Prevotella sp.]|nr:hypothetical protein [Prevotella sp.]